MLTGKSRRLLAADLGHPDISAGIPEARFMRAMIFERLVRDEKFVSELLTTTVGALNLTRPIGVRRADGKVTEGATALALSQAHLKAVHQGEATMITGLAVPYPGLDGTVGATPVKPDFAVVAPRRSTDGGAAEADPEAAIAGSWLVMGDAKDYERVRSRIDDPRMLKGFLQVALGAEAALAWASLPDGMQVHRWGALAVPRNSFLQPVAVVENLDDHRIEVMERARERAGLLADPEMVWPVAPDDVASFVEHLELTFDPGSCVSCSLFNFCRSEVRASTEPVSRLVELGIRPEQRPALLGLVDGSGEVKDAPESLAATVLATVDGLPGSTGQLRTDPVGLPGTISVVLAKSDAAALGVHGVGLQRVGADGAEPWAFEVFENPQAPATRLGVMSLLGEALDEALSEASPSESEEPGPVHLVLPDSQTGDLLVSIADSLAGVEISRLRWERDLEQGRKALTWGGDPATVPDPLTPHQRLAVSFLLEQDRSRAMTLRWPLIDVRAVLKKHFVAGGPLVDHGRLDYLVTWAAADKPLSHREISDAVTASPHTPGARLTNDQSDAIHKVARRAGDTAYAELVNEELTYKAEVMDAAAAVLEPLDVSVLRPVHLALEGDAQRVWRRRRDLHASDLVRFGRVPWFWRNNQVDAIDHDTKCAAQLQALGNAHVLRDLALNAGTREVAFAVVESVTPLRLKVQSRRFGDGTTIAMLQNGDELAVESSDTTLKVQKGSFKFGGLSAGVLESDEQTDGDGTFGWLPKVVPDVEVGSRLVVADMAWFGGGFKSGHELGVPRPGSDTTNAPKAECHDGAYAATPDEHRWCCRSHEDAEAEYSDLLAERRERGELNPQAWPPLLDFDQFDTAAEGTPTGDHDESVAVSAAAHLTADDLD
ncbi:hypothetical protein N802_10220 [Knoellia sinensis KCTC 19936]|uniref:Uncharacterized protein n=2 Tax=Knoellia TaxID=136099 RepID=A0A0A0IXH8_9MICO|nr:hypothetical protein N802_10220 [Knoellia sinensis KCTC 19936]